MKANDIQLSPPVKIPKPLKHPEMIPLCERWTIAPRGGYVIPVFREGTGMNDYGSADASENQANGIGQIIFFHWEAYA